MEIRNVLFFLNSVTYFKAVGKVNNNQYNYNDYLHSSPLISVGKLITFRQYICITPNACP